MEETNKRNASNPSTSGNASSEPAKPKDITLDLPEVSDIPGQENVELPEPYELGDPTIASADEEGNDLFDPTTNAADGTA